MIGVVVVEDGTIFAGYTHGAWVADNDNGAAALAMVKMDADRTVIWRWQVRLHGQFLKNHSSSSRQTSCPAHDEEPFSPCFTCMNVWGLLDSLA